MCHVTRSRWDCRRIFITYLGVCITVFAGKPLSKTFRLIPWVRGERTQMHHSSRSADRGSHLGLNSCENVPLVWAFQDVSAATRTKHVIMHSCRMHAQTYCGGSGGIDILARFCPTHADEQTTRASFPSSLWENQLVRQWQAEFSCFRMTGYTSLLRADYYRILSSPQHRACLLVHV